MNRRKFCFTVAAVAMVAAAKTTGLADTVLAGLGPKQEWSRVVGYDHEQEYTWAQYTRITLTGEEWNHLSRKPGGDISNDEAALEELNGWAEQMYQRVVDRRQLEQTSPKMAKCVAGSSYWPGLGHMESHEWRV